MTENLINVSTHPATSSKSEPPPETLLERTKRPANLPDRFWDQDKNNVLLDDLLTAYLELEQKLQSYASKIIPNTSLEYNITTKNDLVSPDPEVNERLRAAGFSQEQVQLVYDLASDRLMPMLAELASVFETENQLERLKQHFGGEDRWRHAARQIEAWGRRNLPDQVYEVLATTFEGVLTIHRMMSGEEPRLLGATTASSTTTDAALKQLMRDPRYWRDQDPEVVNRVRTGFRNLYRG